MNIFVTKNKLPETVIGYIRGTMMHSRFSESLLEAVIHDLGFLNVIKNRVVAQHCEKYLNIGRNKLVKKVVEQYAAECGVFVSLDTDHPFTPGQLMEIISLVSDDHPVVSALYYAADDDGQQVRPLMLRRRADGTLETMWQFPRNELVEVDVIGMGFCAMKMSVLTDLREELGDTLYNFDETSGGHFMIEDDAFCRRVQEYLALPIYVHTGICVGHVKPFEVNATHERRKVS